MLVLNSRAARIKRNSQTSSNTGLHRVARSDKVCRTQVISKHVSLVTAFRITLVVVRHPRIVEFISMKPIAVKGITPNIRQFGVGLGIVIIRRARIRGDNRDVEVVWLNLQEPVLRLTRSLR